MKKFTALLLLQFCLHSILFSQSPIQIIQVRDHRTNHFYQLFRIVRLQEAARDGKYEKAMEQLDIIGNNFYQDERIGMAHNENSYGTSTDFHPIDGYKRTFCGTAHEYYFRNPGTFESDDDLNLFIKVSPTNQLLNINNNVLRQKLGSDFESKRNLVNGEIDVPNIFHRPYRNNGVTAGQGRLPDQVCLYGPWVAEVEGVITGELGHGNYHEIHPTEQFWFLPRQNLTTNSRCYTISLAVDNSGRFSSYSEYERGTPEQLWTRSPLDGIYAIAFTVKPARKERLKYTIDSFSSQYVQCLKSDGKKHFLVYNRDTLVEVTENAKSELVNVSFEKIGYQLTKNENNISDTSVTGFLVIKSRIAAAPKPRVSFTSPRPLVPPYGGHLLMNVCKRTTSSVKQQLKITLVKIKRLFNNSYGGINPFTNRPASRFHPRQAPPDFNETFVEVELRIQQKSKKISIPNLEAGQEFDFTDFTTEWEDFISNNYRALIVCSSRYGVNDFPLGEMQLGGNPLVAVTTTVQTHFPFEIGDERTDANLFEITYKIELVNRANDNSGLH